MTQYQAVKSLVANDKTNLAVIEGEIAALQQKIDSGAGTTPASSTPTTQLPAQNPPVTIPSPPATSSAK